MLNLRLCNAASTWYSQLKFGHMHLCSMDYKYFSLHCRKCSSFGCTAAIRCGYAGRGPHSDSLYSGSEHRQFNWPRLIKRKAGFPSPRRALIGSYQLWRVNDSPYYRELTYFCSEIRVALHIHVNTPRWFMSIFLLKSNDDTPKNMHFNVFVIVMCFTHCQNDTCTVYHFAPKVEQKLFPTLLI